MSATSDYWAALGRCVAAAAVVTVGDDLAGAEAARRRALDELALEAARLRAMAVCDRRAAG